MTLRFCLLLWLALCAALPARAADPQLLEPSVAFRFSARLLDAHTIEAVYQIAPGYYLYREKLKFSIDHAAVKLGTPQLPAGTFKTDKFFGQTEIYRGDLKIVLPVAGALPERLILKATSQGCADIGICYAPQEHQAELLLAAAGASTVAPAAATSPFLQPAPLAQALPIAPMSVSEDTRIAALFKGSFWALVASFFGFGLLLAFTPCMFPMIPILSGILAPHGARLTHMRGFLLSLAYVIGMAMTYALAGVAAGLLGTMLSATLQNPWVLGGFALIFVALAFSMFGFYELQLPSALQSKLTAETNKLHGGHFAGVFTMGVLSALIVGPCVAAPLAGALLYISQSGNVVLGGSALFVMALGMGVPLLVVGASSGALLPKSGPWMEGVKKVFGVILLGVAIYMITPVIPAVVQMLLWAALLIVAAIFLRAIDALPPGASGARKLGKGIGVIALLAGVAVLVGALSGGRDVLQPLSGLRLSGADTLPPSSTHTPFQRIASRAELDDAIRRAGRPVMLDFYADWCVSCKEMEKFTFADPQVRARFDRMLLLQVDVTDNLAEHQALLKRFSLFGPPGIIFFDGTGAEIQGLRVVGFQPANSFTATLDQVLR